MKKYFKIFAIIFRNAYIRDSKIPGAILLGAGVSIFDILITLVMFGVIFDNVETLAGWSYYQVLFMYCLMKLVSVISGLIFRKGLSKMATETVRKGNLDFYLIKPTNSLLLISMSEPRIYNLLPLTATVVLAIVSFARSGATLTLATLGWFLFTFVLGLVLYYFLSIIAVTPAFWFLRLFSLRDVMNRTLQFARYPIGIYSFSIKVLLMAVFPILAVTYIPATTIFNQPDYRYIVYLFLITVLFGFISISFWKLGEKHYGSASS